MAGINGRRVLLGGLLAGLISNILGVSFAHLVLWGEVQAIVERFHLPPFPAYTPFAHLTTRFLWGVALVWLYAAIRPRYGPGPRTAVRAAVAAWFFLYFVFALGMAPWGFFPVRVLAIMAVWGLGELLLMALAGAWVYRE